MHIHFLLVIVSCNIHAIADYSHNDDQAVKFSVYHNSYFIAMYKIRTKPIYDIFVNYSIAGLERKNVTQ